MTEGLAQPRVVDNFDELEAEVADDEGGDGESGPFQGVEAEEGEGLDGGSPG